MTGWHCIYVLCQAGLSQANDEWDIVTYFLAAILGVWLLSLGWCGCYGCVCVMDVAIMVLML